VRRYNVFIADDERMAREGIADSIAWDKLGLSLAGTASDGQMAYQHIQQLRPDIVITDIMMPIMDGIELIKLTLQSLPETIFIVLSGYGEFELAAQAMKFGVRHYLLKPSSEEEITEALQAALRELAAHEAQREVAEGKALLVEGVSFYETTSNVVHQPSDSTDQQLLSEITHGMDETILGAIISGDETELKERLALFFQALYEVRAESTVATARCLALMETVYTQLEQQDSARRSDFLQIWQMKTLYEIQHYMSGELLGWLNNRKNTRPDKRSLLVAKIKKLTNEHLENRDLSLQWLAQHYLFLNSEYMGKLFRQETDEKYTQYLTKLRIQKATELLTSAPSLKIYEIAEKCGFHEDPQYFSNVFKKITGSTPVEYRKQHLH